MASLEVVSIINLPSVENPEGSNVTLRGISARGIDMRKLKLASGRWFTPGQREVTVGKSVAKRYPDAATRQATAASDAGFGLSSASWMATAIQSIAKSSATAL